MVLEANTFYKATIKLSWIERGLISDEHIATELINGGFKDVKVSSSGRDISATGMWGDQTKEIEIKKMILDRIVIVKA
jgi:hypothetical protein